VARSIVFPIEPCSIVELFPLSVAPDGDEFLVGRHGARTYLALTPIALDATTMLAERLPVGRVKETLAAKYAVDHVSLAPLLEQLLAAGLVRAIDGTSIEPDVHSPARREFLSRNLVTPLFGIRARVVYALIVAGGAAAAVSDPRCLPRVATLIANRSVGLLLLSFVVTAIMTAKHEFAHVAAGRFLGIRARCRLGYRLFFPVVETDLSDLWTIEPRKRYLAYAAGVVSDVLAAALALMATWAHLHGWVHLPPLLVRALEITVLVALGVVIWQFNVFLRTDGYYVLATAIRARNLAGDAKAYLRSRLRANAYPRSVRIFAFGYAVTVVCLSALWVMGLAAALRAGAAGTRGTMVAESIALALLAAGIVTQRRRNKPIPYTLVCPPGL
jgi:putative peptide zinc metalloprotease protein